MIDCRTDYDDQADYGDAADEDGYDDFVLAVICVRSL